ncbi:hypothetical protein [Marinimicrobium sp. C2-29]|uniref:hypothetical protein n=1 Tax=Marinimicrobium sp. C2-29 TaxID=3139825 RepID=UPI00313951DA
MKSAAALLYSSLFLAPALLLSGVGWAQTPPALEPGERVRVHRLDAQSVVGQVERVQDDTLFLIAESRARTMTVPLHSVSRLDVQRRRTRGQGAWHWAKGGFVVGAVAGAVTCSADVERCRESSGMNDAEILLGSALFVGGGLAFIGAVGGAMFPGNYWEGVPVPAQVSLTPVGNAGFRLSATWKF